MIRYLITLFTLASVLQQLTGCASPARLEPADLDRLTGAPWVGTLTYLDYSSQKTTTIDSSLVVRRVEEEPPAWEIGVGYSKEPHADSKELVVLRDGGRLLDEQRIVSREVLANGDLVFVMEARGEDNNRPAVFRFEHRIAAGEYSRRKMVRFEDGQGDGEFFQRHVYRWKR